MKKFFLAAAITLTALFATAPQSAAAGKADRAAIRAAMSKADYASILQRFNAGEALTPSEAGILYYGSALQPGFNASKKYTEINEVYNAGATDKAFRLCEKALATDPTNLALLFKAYASAAVSKDASLKSQAPKIQTRILTICDVIFESDKGVTDYSPFVVIRPSDIEEFVVKYIQPEKVIGHAKIDNLDAYKVDLKGNNNETILYFSIF